MSDRAELTAVLSAAFSGMGAILHYTNEWVSEYMPTLTAIGIIGGLLLSIWFRYESIKQQKRDRALWHKRIEHEQLKMIHENHNRRYDDPPDELE